MKKILVILLLVSFVAAKKRVMPWMCLERCGEAIPADLAQIDKNKALLSAVSFESHNLEANGELNDNHFTRVFPHIVGDGLEGHAMVTTASIDKLRQLWIPANRVKFISDVASVALNNSWHGVNVDFEPEGGAPPTTSDAREFASFLDALALALHEHKISLSVDIASWSAFWDPALLVATKLDRGIVTVISGGETSMGLSGSGGSIADPELAALSNLPVLAPILRGTLAGNILGRVRSESARGMDATAVLLLCRDLQEHLKLCGSTVADAQAVLTSRVSDTEAVSARGFYALQAHAEEVRALVQSLGDVDAVTRDIDVARQRASYAQIVLQRLDAALTSVESEILTSGPTMVLVPPGRAADEEIPQLQ